MKSRKNTALGLCGPFYPARTGLFSLEGALCLWGHWTLHHSAATAPWGVGRTQFCQGNTSLPSISVKKEWHLVAVSLQHRLFTWPRVWGPRLQDKWGGEVLGGRVSWGRVAYTGTSVPSAGQHPLQMCCVLMAFQSTSPSWWKVG